MLKNFLTAVFVGCAILFASCMVQAREPSMMEKVTIAAQIYNYMDAMEHISADFKQYHGKKVSSGTMMIDYPHKVVMDYTVPKHVTVTYDARHPNEVQYYDHTLKQSRVVKNHVNLISLLMEKDFKAVVHIKHLEIKKDLLIASMEYKGEVCTVTFVREKFAIKSIATSPTIKGRKVHLALDLSNITKTA